MEANNIITQVLTLKKSIHNSRLTVIEIDLVKKQLLECYELLIPEKTATDNVLLEEKINATEPVQQVIVEKEEINPFVTVIEEAVQQEINPPAKAQPIVSKEEETVSPVTKKEDSESINEHFENEGGSLNDRFQLSVNKGLNERTTQGDLKKLIDFNRQFVFIQELFNNDATAYMKTIEQLNNSPTLEEAFAYLNKEIIHFYKWRADLQSVKLFEKLVRQKFGV